MAIQLTNLTEPGARTKLKATRLKKINEGWGELPEES